MQEKQNIPGGNVKRRHKNKILKGDNDGDMGKSNKKSDSQR